MRAGFWYCLRLVLIGRFCPLFRSGNRWLEIEDDARLRKRPTTAVQLGSHYRLALLCDVYLREICTCRVLEKNNGLHKGSYGVPGEPHMAYENAR